MLDILVVGSGLAGLTAARVLTRAGRRVRVLEAAEHVGGRVTSRVVDGFTLDAGYQVLFPAYPALRRNVDLDALDLVPIPSGAAVRSGFNVEVLGDPLHDPGSLLGTLTSRTLGVGDKLRLARLVARLKLPAPHTLLHGPDETTENYLRRQGFSTRAVDSFFRPFFGGVFLRRDLHTSARLFRYYLRMLVDGGAALPRGGVGEVTAQLAGGTDVTTGIRVTRLVPQEGGGAVTAVTTAGEIEARGVIVATDPDAAGQLTGEALSRGSLGSTYLYYASSHPLDTQPRLLLRPSAGLINNAQWISNVIPERAPEGQHLLAVSVLELPGEDDAALDAAVRAELSGWYGDGVRNLRTLAVERIAHAQFLQPPEFSTTLAGHATGLPSVLIASEVTSMSSVQGAMESGEKAAAILLGDLAGMSRPRGA
ncbi:NAD(P)/FAD-dependent oxidoreductase [Deinococcus hopiensis]|uniref:Phytoene dehydrogenase-related protein n=1 Tax=Deinococcus hopiensis KR-140 TaxID=695939 RepID=A0A1W1VB31_9DEIO|nr:NAD(P)/FAD-dependent oxidoreductase [Deinococcus hopiensis]SMB90525.1 Phytoene dehydrogenase-related protein [Deinococcus hopiensis KR-140]